jgi:tRNA pseudouridine38-40 synthase
MDDSFHARFSALSKTYEYRILNRPLRSALERDYVWHIRRLLKIEPMEECLEIIKGAHDFAAFMASGSSVKTTERVMFRAELHCNHEHRHFVFEANGFLRHMVRNLVGTIVEVGKERWTPRDFRRILEGKDRRQAGMTAPARGLYLMEVHYGEQGKETLSLPAWK